jgi:hypothetical protein
MPTSDARDLPPSVGGKRKCKRISCRFYERRHQNRRIEIERIATPYQARTPSSCSDSQVREMPGAITPV